MVSAIDVYGGQMVAVQSIKSSRARGKCMSYYCNYKLTVNKRPLHEPTEKEISDLESAVDGLFVFEDGNYSDGWYGYTSWLSDADEMQEIAKKFPNFIFELQGFGEDGDMWRDYFCNEKYQHCQGRVIFDQPDMVALIS